MFKKTKIAAATVALLSAAAMQNVSAAAGPVGLDVSGNKAEVLIFPYYNTNNGISSAFNIRNATSDYKAVKIRFRESKLSNDVLDFNVYMSPWDRYSMSIGVNSAGRATLYSTDKTCTFPTIPAAGVAFKGDVYENTKDADAREGYLEVIEMGVVTDAGTKTGVLHDAAGVPKDCGAVKRAWDAGAFTQGGANAVVEGVNHTTVLPKGISAPTGGLQGWAFLLDFAIGHAFVNVPAAIRNYSSIAQHYKSDDPATFLLPSLASGSQTSSLVVNNAGTAAIVTPFATGVDFATTPAGAKEVKLANGEAGPTASGINPWPISHVLAATALQNDYFVTPAPLNGGADWVVTFPMRKHGVYSNTSLKDGSLISSLGGSTVKIAPSSVFYSAEEQVGVAGDDGFSPVSVSPIDTLPREVNILSFGLKGTSTVAKVLNSVYTKNIGVDFTTGWGNLVFSLPSASVPFKGVPVIGFGAFRGNYKPGAENVIGESVPHTFVYDRSAVAN